MGRSKEFEKVCLANLGHGVAAELVDREIEEVMRNVTDPNTVAKAKRKIIMEITLAPDERRETCAVVVSCYSKLARVKPHESTVHVLKDGGEPVAVQRPVEGGENVVAMAQNGSTEY